MDISTIDDINDQLQNTEAEDVLVWAVDMFKAGRIALASSLGAEDQVLTHMLRKVAADVEIFTIDTGCLYPESYDLIEHVEKKYQFHYNVLTPDEAAVDAIVQEHGEQMYYKSLELRKLCCQVRKILPLKNKLANLDAWVCGLRREQSVTRAEIQKVEYDATFGLIKINPLEDWSEERVWAYIKEHDVPYHALHDQGYPSIGCAPCTRAIQPDEDVRSGRWWWENPEHKECGLHRKPNG